MGGLHSEVDAGTSGADILDGKLGGTRGVGVGCGVAGVGSVEGVGVRAGVGTSWGTFGAAR